jgi:hypothetical protein
LSGGVISSSSTNGNKYNSGAFTNVGSIVAPRFIGSGSNLTDIATGSSLSNVTETATTVTVKTNLYIPDGDLTLGHVTNLIPVNLLLYSDNSKITLGGTVGNIGWTTTDGFYFTNKNSNVSVTIKNGTVTATNFSGPLSGNASTATTATNDDLGRNISSTYGLLVGTNTWSGTNTFTKKIISQNIGPTSNNAYDVGDGSIGYRSGYFNSFNILQGQIYCGELFHIGSGAGTSAGTSGNISLSKRVSNVQSALNNLVFGPTFSATNINFGFTGGTPPTLLISDGPKTGAANLTVSGSLTVSNVAYVGCVTNVMEGIYGYPTATTNVPIKVTPVGLFGYLGFQGSQNIDVVSDGVYVNIVSNGVAYNRVLTNGFTYNAVGGFLTNTVAGYYGISCGATAIGSAGANGKEYELELFVNGIPEEYFATMATGTLNGYYRLNTSGIIYLAANSSLELRIKEVGTSNNDPTLVRYYLKVGTP